MSRDIRTIAVVAPAGPVKPETPGLVQAVADHLFGARAPQIRFHPQCFLTAGHFAGDDAARADAFVEVANDPAVDAVWFGRGGYGSCRMAEQALARLEPRALAKPYLGYSDLGVLLAGLYRDGARAVAHGPMAQDILRDGGEGAVARALGWLVDGDRSALEGSLDDRPAAAFNIAILSQIIGTPLQPDLADHVLMLEEVSEYMYRIDRYLFHITANPAIRRIAGIRLGRCSQVPENDPDFGLTEEAVIRHWCDRSGIAYLGRADIGHDAENKVVPFGLS